MRISDNILLWKLVVKIGEMRSLKDASIQLDLDPAQASRLVKQLESELHIPLLEHKKRPVCLTKEAKVALPNIKILLDAQRVVTDFFENLETSPMFVKLGIPVNVPREETLKALQEYQRTHSHFSWSILAEANEYDLLSKRIDIALIPYFIENPDIISIPIFPTFTCGIASQEYLKNFGVPETVYDLNNHQIIRRTGETSLLWDVLENSENRFRVHWKADAPSGDILQCYQSVLNGEGICFDLSIPLCDSGIRSGSLIPVLPGWHRPVWRVHLTLLRCNFEKDKFKKLVSFLQRKEELSVRNRFNAAKKLLGWAPSI